MDRINRIKKGFGRVMSGRPDQQLKYVGYFFLGIIVLVGMCSLFFDEKYWRAIVAFLSPVPIREGGYNYLKFILYVIGLVVFSGFLVATITNMIRTAGERYVNGTAHYRFKDHILFLGYDEMMMGTLKQELSDGTPKDVVVAVPDNVANVRNSIYQHIPKQHAKRLTVIRTVRTKKEDLKEVSFVISASRIYIIGQPNEETHDANNLTSLGLIASLCSISDNKPLCMYYMRNHATFSLTQRQKIKADNLRDSIVTSGLHFEESVIDKYLDYYCEPFNFHESAARKLLFNLSNYNNALKLDWHDTDKNTIQHPELRPHLVIVGMTEMGSALAKSILISTHFRNQRLKITFVDEKAKDEMCYFTGRYGSFFENCNYNYLDLDDPDKDELHKPAGKDFLDVEFEFIQCNLAHPEIKKMLSQWATNGQELLTIAVCTNNAPRNMAFALYLPKIILDNAKIWVYQKNDTGMSPFLGHDNYMNVHTFSLQDIAIAIPAYSIEYNLAKKVAHAYDVLYGSESAWEEKNATEQWSSLYNALSIVVKLRQSGYGLRLDKDGMYIETFDLFTGEPTGPITLTEDQENTFATAEHSRWNVEKLMAGFIPTTEQQHKDIEEGKLLSKQLKNIFIHDDIRPFDELRKSEQEKDFTLTRSLINVINNSSGCKTSLR